MQLKVIKTEQDHQEALARIDQLWEAELNTPEGDELELLTVLVSLYEEKYHPIEQPDPVEAIKFRMEQQGLQYKDLVPILGQRSRVTEVMNKKRGLSIAMIRKLNKELHIPLECLVKEYDLVK